MKHFRVDKMDNIKLDYEKREGKEAFKALKLTDRSLKVFSMFGGTEENVTMHCNFALLSNISFFA